MNWRIWLVAMTMAAAAWAADEATVKVTLQYVKGNDDFSRDISQRVTVTGTNRLTRFVTVTTATNRVDLADVASPGLTLIRNQSAITNATVYLSYDGTNALLACKWREPAVFRMASTNLWVWGTTNQVLEINVLPD